MYVHLMGHDIKTKIFFTPAWKIREAISILQAGKPEMKRDSGYQLTLLYGALLYSWTLNSNNIIDKGFCKENESSGQKLQQK